MAALYEDISIVLRVLACDLGELLLQRLEAAAQ
jgi:hypothetical protein